NGKFNMDGKNERNISAIQADIKTAPRVPSTDLLGLTFGKSGCLPKLLPINNAPISAPLVTKRIKPSNLTPSMPGSISRILTKKLKNQATYKTPNNVVDNPKIA